VKTVVITGSARGFGYELAKEFKANNFNVVISDINKEGLKAAEDSLKKSIGAGNVLAVACDVTKYEDLENLWNKAADRFISIDVWINNAGVNQPDKAIYELTDKEVDFVLNVDLHGAIYGSQVAFKNMKNQGYGAIYNLEGYGSNDAMMKGLNIYGTSKRAITHFTRALAKESKELGLNINVGRLSPGIMITDFLTSSGGKNGTVELSEKTKMVYNILGDYPEPIAKFMVKKIKTNTRNDVRFNWLTGFKAFTRFMCAGFNKRDFFSEN